MGRNKSYLTGVKNGGEGSRPLLVNVQKKDAFFNVFPKKPLAFFESVLCFAGLRPRDNKEDDYNQKEKGKHTHLSLEMLVKSQSGQSSD